MLVALSKRFRPFAFSLSVLACGCGDVGTSQEAGNVQPVNVFSDGWVTADVQNIIPENELNSVQEDARHGNNSAVDRLAEHYRTLGQPREQVEWLVMAASRGDCSAMAHLREFWQNRGNSSLSSRWNNQLRANRCTWAKAYGRLPEGTSRENDMPLWTE